MKQPRANGFARLNPLILAFLGFLAPDWGRSDEFRGLWVDTFHAALRNPIEVSQLVADARAGHFNAVVVEIRKRGDAYYNSLYEPKATDVSPQSFDPLADLVAKAHDTDAGPRIEVHAWIVTYNIWNGETTLPLQPNHPYRLHPDWVTRSVTGETWDGYNYAFDPGHPEVQKHTFNVAMDIVGRYDIDGLHFDYIRYGGNTWGYHPVSLERFRTLYQRSGTPSNTDAQWLQFRRDQVTALVRKVYLSALAIKPQVRISAALITWAPGITTDAEWPSSAAYSSVLQDWRAWMEEGILDLSIPMAYFRQHTHAADWAKWSQFAKDHRYRRHTAIGSGIFLNTVSNSIVQFRSTRVATPAGHSADGLCGYSYAGISNEGVPRSEFLEALTQPSGFDPNPVPVFPTPTKPAPMPWKTSPTLGHLAGYATNEENGLDLDGATITVSGQVLRVLSSDGTGFYGAVDLPPGEYTVAAAFADLEPQSSQVTISAGEVSRLNFGLARPAEIAFFGDLRTAAGVTSAILGWTTDAPAVSWVEFGSTTNLGVATASLSPTVDHERLLTGLMPDTDYFFQLVASVGTEEYRSLMQTFHTAGQLIIDNPQAGFGGRWSIGSSSPDKYQTNYHYAGTTTGEATATATFTPNITSAGHYNVQVWYPQGGNRSAAAPFLVRHAAGSLTVPVNQTVAGGGWRLLAADLPFQAGTNGFVQLSNNSGETSRVVLADAVRFVYGPNQDPPPPGTVPDWWAEYYFGSPVEGLADLDGDHYSNHAEFVCGTRPDDPISHLQVRVENLAEGGCRLIFAPFHAGRTYQLERTDTLADWQVLTHLVPVETSPGEAAIIDTDRSAAGRFYRLRIQWAP